MKAAVGIDRPLNGELRVGIIHLDVRDADGCPVVLVEVLVPCDAPTCPLPEHKFEMAVDAQDCAAFAALLVEHGQRAIRFGSDGG